MNIQMQHRVEAVAVLLGAPLTSEVIDRPSMCCGVLDDGDHLCVAMGGAFACRRAPLIHLRGGAVEADVRLTGRSAAQSPNLPVDLAAHVPARACAAFLRFGYAV